MQKSSSIKLDYIESRFYMFVKRHWIGFYLWRSRHERRFQNNRIGERQICGRTHFSGFAWSDWFVGLDGLDWAVGFASVGLITLDPNIEKHILTRIQNASLESFTLTTLLSYGSDKKTSNWIYYIMRTLNVPGITQYHWEPNFLVLNT